MLALVGAVVIMAIVMALPTPEGLSPQGQRLAAIFALALVLWTTEALPVAATSILVLALQPMFGLTSLAPPDRGTPTAILGIALANFMSPPFFFVLVMFVIAFAWVKTGLAHRFALWMIGHAGTDAKRVVYAFMFGTALISTVVSDVPSAAIFMAVAIGIFDRLGLQPGRSQLGKAVMMGIPIAALIGGVATPAGSSINILGLTMIEQNGGERVPFLHWMTIGIPMVVILLPAAAWVLLKFHPPEIATIGALEDIRQEQSRLGPLSSDEFKVLVIMGAMIAFWILSTWYPAFDTTLVAICGAVVMFMPGVSLFTWKQAQDAIGWETLMMLGGVTSLGIASRGTGLATWLAEWALGGLHDLSYVWIIAAVSAFTVVLHLPLPVNPALVAVMIPPIMVVGQTAGVNPVLYALPIVFTASCAFLLPLDSVPLVTYARGYYKIYDMFRPGLVISVLWVVLMTVLLVVIGPLVGLL